MLNSLRDRATTFELPECDSGNADVVASRSQIFLLLKRIFEQHCLLTVQVGAEDEPFSTAMIELVGQRRYLVLDELMPGNGQKRLRQCRNITVTTQLNGVGLKFAGRVESANEDAGAPYYKVPFPKRIYYPQRREEYRVTVPLDWGATASIEMHGRRLIDGDVRDISAGGACVQVPAETLRQLSQSPQPALCTLHLPDGLSIEVDAEIRHIVTNERRNYVRLGIRFLDISAADHRRIEHCVASIDRMQTRIR
jgi:c-di-GMP-binding flagellar brake protein YcgR